MGTRPLGVRPRQNYPPSSPDLPNDLETPLTRNGRCSERYLRGRDHSWLTLGFVDDPGEDIGAVQQQLIDQIEDGCPGRRRAVQQRPPVPWMATYTEGALVSHARP